MDDNEKQDSKDETKNLKAEDVFAGELNLSPSTDDIFGGGQEVCRTVDAGSEEIAARPASSGSITYEVQTGNNGTSKSLIVTQAMLGVLTLAVIGLILRPAPAPVVQINSDYPGITAIKSDTDLQEGQQNNTRQPQVSQVETEKEGVDQDSIDKEVIEEPQYVFSSPLSWNLSYELFKNKDYRKAYYVYEKLSENLAMDDSQSDIFKDILQLQMGLCQYFDGKSDDISSLFTNVLQSRSPAVRTMANYYLSFIEFKAKQYLSSRTRAYRAMASLNIIKKYFPESIEADCYFLMANAVMCELALLDNRQTELPGKNWADTLNPYILPEMDTSQLRQFLTEGMNELNAVMLEPVVNVRQGLTNEVKYSAMSMNAPAGELVSKYAAASGTEITWNTASRSYNRRPVTMYLAGSAGQLVPEYAIGSIGLIARMDGDSIMICNPQDYSSLSDHKELLGQEGIAVWRRFMLRYRGEKRLSNAHYGLALLHEMANMPHVAIGEYKIISSQYNRDALAPYALLNSCKLKTSLNDFIGARRELKELVIQYPDAKIADMAYLYLAQATSAAQLHEEAFNLYMKVYYLNLTNNAKSEGAYGAAISKYSLEDYSGAEQWFTRCIKAANENSSVDIYSAYYMLAKTRHALGKYAQAFEAYKLALPGNLGKEEFCKIGLEMAETLIKSSDLLKALNLLENIKIASLGMGQVCDVLATKAKIYRAMGLPENGISLLNRKIEYMADYQMRAKLVLELSRCYLANGNLELAHEEMVTAISDLAAGELALKANNELAEICIKLERYQQAEEICLNMLSMDISPEIRHQTFSILGRVYQLQKKYKKAAEAFAGKYEKLQISKLSN